LYLAARSGDGNAHGSAVAEIGLRHTPCELALAQHEDRAD